jgi:hypothetical protein
MHDLIVGTVQVEDCDIPNLTSIVRASRNFPRDFLAKAICLLSSSRSGRPDIQQLPFDRIA